MKLIFYLCFISKVLSFKIDQKFEKNSTLIKFACDVVESEVESSLEVRNVAILIGENKFPRNFDKNLLKCLPKIPQTIFKFFRSSVNFPDILKAPRMPKSTMILFLTDCIDEVKITELHWIKK